MRPFSLRHRSAIFNKRISVSLPTGLRGKIWRLFFQYNCTVYVQPDPTDNWHEPSDALTEVENDLKLHHGWDDLLAFPSHRSETVEPVDLKGFVMGAYPTQVLDAVEIFQSHLVEEKDWKLQFQRAINQAFEDEECSWRLSDGMFFKVDSEFLAVQVLEKAHELAKTEGYQGPVDEFRQARGDLTVGDHKGAIVNSCNAMESTLKVALGRTDGNARDLLKDFIEKGYCDDIPEGARAGFRDQVLQALPFLRNKLGGHGQGSDVVEVPKAYADLAVHLAGSFIQFVINRATACKPKEAVSSFSDKDDVPF